MPAVIRNKVDSSQGHCFSPRPPDTGSPDVWVNSSDKNPATNDPYAAVRATPTKCSDTESGGCGTHDHYPSHGCPDNPPHDGCAQVGSGNVFVNCQPFHRDGDAISCGDTANNGSPNVFANSGGGPGTIIDNNPPYNTTSNPPPPGEYVGESPAARDFHDNENDDPVELVKAPPAGTSASKAEVIEEEQPEQPPPETPPTQDCSTIDSLPDTFVYTDQNPDFDAWADSFALSPNFTVADMTSRAHYPHRFSTSMTQASGFTQKPLLKNLCFHAKTVLEPMLAAYGPFRINSGFRQASGSSQHNRGQATDLQYPGKTYEEYWALGQQVRDEQTYDQYIFEHGNSVWFHLSSNSGGHRKKVNTFTGSSYLAGLVKLR